jgi:hypothetical protein
MRRGDSYWIDLKLDLNWRRGHGAVCSLLWLANECARRNKDGESAMNGIDSLHPIYVPPAKPSPPDRPQTPTRRATPS